MINLIYLTKNFYFFIFSVLVVKVLGFIKKRLFLTKFRVPKFFKLNNSSVPDESDSEEEDLSRYREPSTTPIPRSPQQVPRIPVLLPSRVKVEASSFSRRISHDDNEMTEIFRSVASSSTLKIPETSSIAQRSSTPISLSDRPMTPAMRRVLNENISQPDRSATPFANQNGRVQCQGLTIKGIQCKNAATPGSNRCRMHT